MDKQFDPSKDEVLVDAVLTDKVLMKKSSSRRFLWALIPLVLVGVLLLVGAVPRWLTNTSTPVKAAPVVERSIDTLEDEVHLSGKEPEGTKLVVSVFAYSYDEERRVFYRSQVTVGSSGIYNMTLPLPVLGVQYVEVETEGKTVLYEYHRYDSRLPLELSNYYLNLFDAVRQP